MILEITYTEDDNLENLSEFILDLNSDIHRVKLLFKCEINRSKLEEDLYEIKDIKHRKKHIEKNLSNHLKTKIYTFNTEGDSDKEGSFQVVEKKYF